MRRQIHLHGTIIVVGVLLTLIACVLSFSMEYQNIVRQRRTLSLTNLERSQEALGAMGSRMDASISYLNRGSGAWGRADFSNFLNQVEDNIVPESDWMVAVVVPPAELQNAAEIVQQEVGDQSASAQSIATNGEAVAAITYVLNPQHHNLLGFNIASIAPVVALLNATTTSSNKTFGILPAGGQLGFFKNGGLLVAKSIGGSSGFGNRLSHQHLLVRIVSTEELRDILEVASDESVLIRGQGVQLGSSTVLDNPRSVSLTAANPWPSGIDITLLPSAPRMPLAWLPVAIIGLLGTALASFAKAGARLRSQRSEIALVLRGTQSSLEEAQAFDEAFFNNSGTANCVYDLSNQRFLRVNDRMTELLGYSREELLTGKFGLLTHPDDEFLTKSKLTNLGEDANPVAQFEKRYIRKDGRPVFCLLNVRALKSAETQNKLLAATILDVSDRQEQEKLRNALTKELAHRLRNTAQLTTVIARQTAKNADTVQEYETKFQQRLQALRVAQDLFESEWTDAPLDAIFKSILAPFIDNVRSAAVVSIDVPPLKLPPQHAQTLALAIHELAVNSFEHGALAYGGGVAVIGTLVTQNDKQILNFKWVERSTHAPDRLRKSGFGMRMLTSALPDQFGGSADIQWTPKGLVYEANLHMPKVDA